jgi:ubiquinone/menaquinone biosynthesis C-methylase UbiE
MNQSPNKLMPHAVLDLSNRRMKALKIERLLNLSSRSAPIHLLEIGTGSGGIAHYFGTHPLLNCEVVAVDIKDQRQTTEGYHFESVSNTILPFPDASFDVVITNHVIDHVGDRCAQKNHLGEIRRVLRSDGVGYLAVCNRWMINEPHYHLLFLSWLPKHFRTPYLRIRGKGNFYDCEPLTLKELEKMFDETGFEYKNLSTRGLRETIDIEGGKFWLTKGVSILSDSILEWLKPLNPTLIYILKRR